MATTDQRVVELTADVAEQRGNYERACQMIAAMHAAAMGEVCCPNRGVVEDVADLRARSLAAEARVRALEQALRGLLDDITEYQTLNQLGGENNHWQVVARALLADAPAERAEPQGWQPIATALMDGTPILIGWHGKWYDLPEGWHTRCARFDREYEYNGPDDNDVDQYRGGWTDGAVRSFGCQEVHEYHPTHWMPLPEPPR